ncbi:hypothetical protein D3C80_195700 [compost metagenome]
MVNFHHFSAESPCYLLFVQAILRTKSKKEDRSIFVTLISPHTPRISMRADETRAEKLICPRLSDQACALAKPICQKSASRRDALANTATSSSKRRSVMLRAASSSRCLRAAAATP